MRKEIKPILLLSIQEMHAERIFAGVKKFELRRKLPKKKFSSVYLLQSGGGGVVGYFKPGHILRADTENLWKKVGSAATTKARFEAYFKDSSQGCAIPIKSPVRFTTPIFPLVIKRNVPSFSVPMSYLIVSPKSELFKLLEKRSREEKSPLKVTLRHIELSEHSQYKKWVTPLISARYDDITNAFASNILSIDHQGIDLNGILTIRKEVLAVLAKGKLIGFTTVTFKLGGALKTGPTVLFPRFRGRGYGLGLRRSLTTYALSRGIRKLYCTCPDNDNDLILHFIRSGFSVEAHLLCHYAQSHGELVLGMLLKSKKVKAQHELLRNTRSASIVETSSCEKESLAKALAIAFASCWIKISRQTARMLVEKAFVGSFSSYEEKPVSLVVFKDQYEYQSIGLLIHKRGGASKVLLWTATCNVRVIKTFISEIVSVALGLRRKKLYVLHPWEDTLVIGELKSAGFQCEGILREPYISGRDLLVFSKFIGN